MDQQVFRSENVHLWSTILDVSDQIYEVLKPYLSPDEIKRADRFAFSHDRRSFIVSRGILRDILSRYLHCHPADIRFRYEPNGKPALELSNHSLRLDFNSSHSAGYFVVAVTQGKKVGVDIELIKPIQDMDLIASHSFSEYEQNMLSMLTGEERQQAFFRCWTRKEAYLKAIGSGLSVPLDSFDVSLSADNPISMLSNHLDPNQISRWAFYTFSPLQGIIGALVIEDQSVIPYFRKWSLEG